MKKKNPIKKKIIQRMDNFWIIMGRFMILRRLKELGIPEEMIKGIMENA